MNKQEGTLMACNQTWLDCDLPLDKTFPLLKLEKWCRHCGRNKMLAFLEKNKTNKNKNKNQVRSFSWINTAFDKNIPDTGKSVT